MGFAAKISGSKETCVRCRGAGLLRPYWILNDFRAQPLDELEAYVFTLHFGREPVESASLRPYS
jgi:hypothetical protein